VSDEQDLRSRILRIATASKFDLAAIAPLEVPERDQNEFDQFFSEGRHGTMAWLLRHLPFKKDPTLLLPGARSALVLGTFYRTNESDSLISNAKVRISRYAMGPDYHAILRRRGRRLAKRIRRVLPEVAMRFCVDSVPVPERTLARLAGIGFQGKNTMVIHPKFGSYFFLSVLLIAADLEPDSPATDRCGACRLCVDACPTGALTEYHLDARKCISYLTIEHEGSIPPEFSRKKGGWIFGCDICQDVCPYNRSQAIAPHWYKPRAAIAEVMNSGTIGNWTEVKSASPLGRISEERALANLENALG